MDLLKILNDPNHISANEATKNPIRERFGLLSSIDNNLITKEEFISKIRSKYPVYNNIDDATLFNKIIAKYPVYKNQIVGFNNQKPIVTNLLIKQQTTPNKLIKMNETLLLNLYNKYNLSQKGDFNTFKSDMANPNVRQAFFNKYGLAKKGNYATFESDLLGTNQQTPQQQTTVAPALTPKQQEEIAKNKLLDLYQVYLSNGLPPDIVDSTEFLMCSKEEGLEQLYNFGKEKFVLNQVSFSEFKSWFSDYQKFYKKIPLEYLANDIWKSAYEDALKKGYSSDFESYKKYIWNNDEEFEKLFNNSPFKESGISRKGLKNLLFPKSEKFILENVKDSFQKKEVIYLGCGLLFIVLLFIIIRKIGFNNLKNSSKNIFLNKFSKVKNIINVFIKPKLNESYFQILFILWSFVNMYFFISGITAYEQENKEAFWVLNMDYKNEYDFSELFVYIGFPWLVYYIYFRYFKNKK